MDKILEMRAQRAKLANEARALIDRAEAEKREMSAEERGQWETILGEAEKLKNNIDLAERQAALELDVRDAPPASRDTKNVEERKLEAFRRFLTTGAREEYRALANDSDASGGYLHAAEQFVNRLIQGLDNMVFVRQYATILPVTSADELGAPSLDDDLSDPTWTTEVAEISEDTTMAFGRRSLKPNQLSKLIKVAMKLLRTSVIPVENLVADRMARKFAIAQENNFLNGDGSNEPLGIFEASDDGVPTSRDVSSGNTDTAITADGLVNAKYAMKGQYRSKARWIFHRDAMKMISKLKDGEGQYLWRAGIAAGEPDTLLGIPVDESEYVPNTFTTTLYVGALACWEYYWIAELQGLEMQRLNELYARNSQIGFIGRAYADGAPVLPDGFVRVQLA